MNTKIFNFVFALLISMFGIAELFAQNGSDFFFYPTPSELFEVIDKEEISYNTDLLNPAQNYQNYNLSSAVYLNMGVYISDLAYSAFFLKKARCFDYLVTITALSDALLISSELKERFNEDVITNSENMDSVYAITNKYYYDVMRELDENNSKNALYIITTGAYVEAFYIALNSTESYSEGNDLLRKIAEQKALLINLNKFSKLCKMDAGLLRVIKYQEEIIAIFNKFLVEEGTKRTFIRTDDGRIEFIGGPKITMNGDQFEELKIAINRIRDEIVN